MRLARFASILLFLLFLLGTPAARGQVKLDFDFNRREPLVTEDHYGIFYEEINHAGDVTCVYNRYFTTTHVDMTVHATKNGGSEGFLILFDYKDAQNYSWLNLRGWGNAKHAVEQCKNGVKSTLADKDGKLTTGKDYTICVLKEGLHVRCYLDGELIIDGKKVIMK